MKIAIIGFNSKKYMPYLTFYRNILDECKITYDFFTWNRYGEKINIEQNETCFKYDCEEKYIKKIKAFFIWKRWILKYLKNNEYDKIIVLTSIPGVLLYKYLSRNYKEKYIFDFRDYSYEKYGFYKRIINGLIEKSYITCISSRGFLKFLNESKKIQIIHNLPNYSIENRKLDFTNVNIGYLGMLSYYNNNKELINRLQKKDVHLYYIGSYIGEKNKIEEYVKSQHITNVTFVGEFNNSEKKSMYQKYNINFINAVYGNDSLLVTTALPNKLYDCLSLKIPIIVSNNTYLSKIVLEYGLGIAVDIDDDVYSKLKLFLENFDETRFNNSANNLLKAVYNEQQNTVQEIIKFIKK